MTRMSLADFFADLVALRGECVVYDDGCRSHVRSYADTTRAARAFARRLSEAGVHQGDRILIWAENSPEWIAALWGALISGVVVVPIDYRSSSTFAARVSSIVEARL